MNKVHRKYVIFYIVIVFLAIVYVGYVIIFSNKEKSDFGQDNWEDYRENWENTYTKEKIDIDKVDTYEVEDEKFTIKKQLELDEVSGEKVLAIHAHNQQIKVYISGNNANDENDVLYDSNNKGKTFMLSSFSSMWIYIPIKEKHIGKNITIEYKSELTGNKIQINEILLGEKSDINSYLLKKNAIYGIFAMGLVATSLFVVVFWILMRNMKNKERMEYIAEVSFLLSICLTAKILSALFPEKLMIIEITEIIELNVMLCIPIVISLYVVSLTKELPEEKEEIIDGFQIITLSEREKILKSAHIIYVIEIIIMLLCNILLFLVKSDRKVSCSIQNLKYVSLLIIFVYLIGIIIIRLFNKDRDKKEKKFTIGVLVAVVIMLGDVIVSLVIVRLYDNVVGMICGSIIMIVVDVESIDEFFKFILRSIEAKERRDLASIDILTKQNSRIAYVDYIDNIPKNELVGKGAISIDINNLKLVNDSLGHAAGDRYIVECVEKITSMCKNEGGQCYRTGGDEFVILFENIKEKDFKEISQKFDEFIMSKRKFEGTMMTFAYGCAIYDKFSDNNLYDTVKRADKEMYDYKIMIKKKLNIMFGR